MPLGSTLDPARRVHPQELDHPGRNGQLTAKTGSPRRAPRRVSDRREPPVRHATVSRRCRPSRRRPCRRPRPSRHPARRPRRSRRRWSRCPPGPPRARRPRRAPRRRRGLRRERSVQRPEPSRREGRRPRPPGIDWIQDAHDRDVRRVHDQRRDGGHLERAALVDELVDRARGPSRGRIRGCPTKLPETHGTLTVVLRMSHVAAFGGLRRAASGSSRRSIPAPLPAADGVRVVAGDSAVDVEPAERQRVEPRPVVADRQAHARGRGRHEAAARRAARASDPARRRGRGSPARSRGSGPAALDGTRCSRRWSGCST